MCQDMTEKALIDLMVRQETLMADLYTAYSQCFPTYHQFWMELAQEELQHAEWLKRLYTRSLTGTGHVVTERIDASAIQVNVTKIEACLEQSQRSDLTLSEAVAASLELEACVCENEYFKVFEGASEWAEFKQVQYCLAEATRHHVEKIRSLLEG